MSTTKIEVERLRIACENYLLRRDRSIEKEREEMIQAEMNRRWFRAKTREAAIKRLSSDCWNSYNMIEVQGGYWASKVKALLKLAQESDDGFVHVDDEMIGVIF